ncbi:unnamed protein product [Rhodiola kirilowii]
MISIQDFKQQMKIHPLHSKGLIKTPKVLANIVESLIGAIFLDSGFSLDMTWQICTS